MSVIGRAACLTGCPKNTGADMHPVRAVAAGQLFKQDPHPRLGGGAPAAPASRRGRRSCAAGRLCPSPGSCATAVARSLLPACYSVSRCTLAVALPDTLERSHTSAPWTLCGHLTSLSTSSDAVTCVLLAAHPCARHPSQCCSAAGEECRALQPLERIAQWPEATLQRVQRHCQSSGPSRGACSSQRHSDTGP